MPSLLERRHLLTLYRKHHNPALARHFALAQCSVETSARGTVVVDETGREFLDIGTAHGIFGVGHCHPYVQAAVLRQLAGLATAPAGVPTLPSARLAARLTELLPGDLEPVLFAGSGSEGIELALRTALLARPGRTRFIAADQGYHGKTLGALGIMGPRHLREPFEPLWPDVVQVPYGDEDAMRAAMGEEVAAVVLEPILGGGTVQVPPPEYLRAVRALCDRYGALLVVDEVQTGLGRTGRLFGIDHAGVVPDAIVLSKTLTGGHVPIAVTVLRRAVLEAVERHVPSLAEWGAGQVSHPLAAAAAVAAVEVVVDERLDARAARLGGYFRECLATLAYAFPESIVDTPGIGLMTGIRVRNRLVEHALWLQLQRRGVILGLSLNSGATTPVLRAYPPLTVERGQLDRTVEALYDALETLRRGPRALYALGKPALRLQFHLPIRTLQVGANRLASIPDEKAA